MKKPSKYKFADPRVVGAYISVASYCADRKIRNRIGRVLHGISPDQAIKLIGESLRSLLNPKV